jgi:small subunit ribosomal protein S8
MRWMACFLAFAKQVGNWRHLEMSIDTIGDFLTAIRNALMVGKRSVVITHSQQKEAIASVLKNEGFIKDFSVETVENKPVLAIALKYVAGESVIHEINRVSTPGRRQYEKSNGITSVTGGLGVSILTTSKGVLSDRRAKELGIGGEVICHVW